MPSSVIFPMNITTIFSDIGWSNNGIRPEYTKGKNKLLVLWEVAKIRHYGVLNAVGDADRLNYLNGNDFDIFKVGH